MPNITPVNVFIRPLGLCNFIRNSACRIVLIAAHNLQNAVRVICNSIKTDKLMRHRDRKEMRGYILPSVHRLIIEIRPMEVIVLIELPVGTGVSEIYGFIRRHGDEHLNQRKQAAENAFMSVFFDLIARLTYGYATLLQLYVNDWHTVDKQHQITATVVQHFRLSRECRLFRYLVSALTGSNFLPVINLQTDFFAVMQLIIGVITLDMYGLTVDETIEF